MSKGEKAAGSPLIPIVSTMPLIIHRLPPEEADAIGRAMRGEEEDMQRQVSGETIELRYEMGNDLIRAALVIKTASDIRVFRGKWVDNTADALRTLIQELGKSITGRQLHGSLDQAAELRRLRDDNRGLQLQAENLAARVEELEQRPIHEIRDLRNQNRHLVAQVEGLKAKHRLIDAALGTMIEAVGEPEN